MMKNSSISRREFLGRSVYAGGAALLAASSQGFARSISKPRPKPNIVYVLVDQWRAQALGYAGDPNVKTPYLDELAARSVNFENAVSVCPVCTPYRASLLTGKYPLSTGMFLNDLYLPSDELCMAEIFKSAGYDTGYIGKWHLDGHGRDVYIPKDRRQGFDYWKVLECTHNYNNSLYYSGEDKKIRKWDGYDAYSQTKDAQKYIRDHAKKDKPFLLMMSYGGPHFPHNSAPQELKDMYPPESIKLRPNVTEKYEESARKEAQGYYAHCTALDNCISDLYKTLEDTGAADNTIFVFTSDHGEMLGSQDQPPKQKQRPWDESIRVPFLLRYPAGGVDKGRKVKAPINTPDILPTLLSFAGVDIPNTVEGEDVSQIAVGKGAKDRAALFMSVSPFCGWSLGKGYRGIRTSRYTYVRDSDGPWLMYDNQLDPYQLKNLIGIDEHAGLQKELEAKLRVKLKDTGDKLLPKEHYIKQWGYNVDSRGQIVFWYEHPKKHPVVQSPQKIHKP
jgi:arylsulfatase A-like enzyme